MGITIDISHEAEPDEKFSILRYANSLRGGMAETQFSVCLIRQVFTWGLESGYLVPVPPRLLTMSQSNTGLDWSKPRIVTVTNFRLYFEIFICKISSRYICTIELWVQKMSSFEIKMPAT